MLATVSERPPGPDPAWAIEMKWDGIRAISQISRGGARFWSRNGRDMTLSFPELAEAFPGITGLVLDGEIVAPNPVTGAPSFGRLQHRLGTRPSTALRAAVPVRYFVFDVLEIATESVMDLSYLERRERLDELQLDGGPIRVPPTWIGEDPARMLRIAADASLEGIVLKRIDSTYRPGQRSRAWLKVPLRKVETFAVAGWLDGTGANQDSLGSLVLAGRLDGQLRFAGCVGSGFTNAGRHAIRAALDQIARPDLPLDVEPPPGIARSTHWCDPVIAVDVAFRELTDDGVLRQPSFKGVRSDVDVSAIGWPS
ncbi:ATP-dependent DNA ligase [Nocardia sp. NEAU-G5]|uniref:DNA ligase (ATP) n=2 Tax=Nocardia albiluteola TaxID=2842303 RepID=A0ABS6AYR9_9NOCA|nr:ATP-dependent DNA ligase [Nocardia albiluteola]